MTDTPHVPESPENNGDDVFAHSSSSSIVERLIILEQNQKEIFRRVQDIENTDPKVRASQQEDLIEDVSSMRKAFYVFGFSVISGAIVFAFGVFELLGRG